MAAQGDQLRRIVVEAKVSGNTEFKKLANDIGGINQSAKSLASTMNLLKSSFVSYFSVLGIREIVNMSDSIQLLRDRISVLTGDLESARDVLERLREIGDRTGASVDGLATVFARLGASTKEMGLTTADLLDLTELLQNSFRSSGSTAQEATAAVVQLTQAFSAGKVQGEELKSVLEQNLVVADILRKKFGSDIREQASKGLILPGQVMATLLENMQKINADASKLTPTIGQTLTKAFNRLNLAILDLNTTLGLSTGFASLVEWMIDRIPTLVTILAGLAVRVIPLLVTGVLALGSALIYTFVTNPVGAIIGGIAAALIAIAPSFTMIERGLRGWLNNFLLLIDYLDTASQKLSVFVGIPVAEGSDALKKYIQENKKVMAELDQKMLDDADPAKKMAKEMEESTKRIEALRKRLWGDGLPAAKEKGDPIRNMLARLNRELMDGKINLIQYNRELDRIEVAKVTQEFNKGKIAVGEYNEKLIQLQRVDVARDFNNNVISLKEYKEAMQSLNTRDLNDQFARGKIAAYQYHQELAKITEELSVGGSFRAASASYLEGIGTINTQLAAAITNSFTKMEDAFVEFTQTGKFSFKDFANSIIEDLTRITFRMLVLKPLMESIFGVSAGATGTAVTNNGYAGGAYGVNTFARGGAFDNGLTKFASGGVVDSPTVFGFGRGKMGLMGEAGPEAILPLKRTGSGDLGVQGKTPNVYINIDAPQGTTAQTTETTNANGDKMISVIINNAVRDGIARGEYDKTFASSYGMKRRGT